MLCDFIIFLKHCKATVKEIGPDFPSCGRSLQEVEDEYIRGLYLGTAAKFNFQY